MLGEQIVGNQDKVEHQSKVYSSYSELYNEVAMKDVDNHLFAYNEAQNFYEKFKDKGAHEETINFSPPPLGLASYSITYRIDKKNKVTYCRHIKAHVKNTKDLVSLDPEYVMEALVNTFAVNYKLFKKDSIEDKLEAPAA